MTVEPCRRCLLPVDLDEAHWEDTDRGHGPVHPDCCLHCRSRRPSAVLEAAAR